MSSVKIISENDQIESSRWDDFVRYHPGGNFFQSAGIYKLLNDLPDFYPFCITAWMNNELVGILQAFRQREGKGIKSYLSRRLIIYGGPLVDGRYGNDTLIARRLIETLNQKNDSLYTEFRNLTDLSEYYNIFLQAGYHYNRHLNYIVNLPGDEETALALLNSSKRRQVRKSLKNGAEIVEPTGIEEVQRFYSILKNLYREKIKKPLPNWNFFEKFYKSKELGVYLLIRYKGNIIGGIMCPVFNNTLYEWYICGEDGKYKNIYPSVLATYAPIQYGAKNGYKYFDFLGAGKPGQDYGVREFKSKFGGNEVEYGRFLRINNPLLYTLGKLGYKVSKKLLA
jgi:lipid II:glycine glycyltransferase (peptidoglycan interpeptide bridge formation enzyme)